MAKRIDLFDSTYSHFTKQVLETIRKETFGQDIGQNSWTTLEEYTTGSFRGLIFALTITFSRSPVAPADRRGISRVA